jgi:hypothetical protein
LIAAFSSSVFSVGGADPSDIHRLVEEGEATPEDCQFAKAEAVAGTHDLLVAADAAWCEKADTKDVEVLASMRARAMLMDCCVICIWYFGCIDFRKLCSVLPFPVNVVFFE